MGAGAFKFLPAPTNGSNGDGPAVLRPEPKVLGKAEGARGVVGPGTIEGPATKGLGAPKGVGPLTPIPGIATPGGTKGTRGDKAEFGGGIIPAIGE